jgi:hypothetical protein
MRFFRLFVSVPSRSFFWIVLAVCPGVLAQSPPSASDPAAQAAPAKTADAPPVPTEERPKDEVSTRDTAATFRVRVNLVQVRVVVRDEHGNVVPDLHREDFQIFDNRKPQLLSTFNVDALESKAASLAPSGGTRQTPRKLKKPR